ncbi:MAG: hypothetical protein CM1200mP8_7190 [Chloroflexota bacterium]|nr:MAG: hypothetical protein CM1200mP8_7190 [Chloroflexota bacterium]
MNFFISEQDNPALFPDSSKEEHLSEFLDFVKKWRDAI